MDIYVVSTPLLLWCCSHCPGAVALVTCKWISVLGMEFLGRQIHDIFSLGSYFQIALQRGWPGLYLHQQRLNAICVSVCGMWEPAHGITAFQGEGPSFYQIL